MFYIENNFWNYSLGVPEISKQLELSKRTVFNILKFRISNFVGIDAI